jgi:hypothetical protein
MELRKRKIKRVFLLCRTADGKGKNVEFRMIV